MRSRCLQFRLNRVMALLMGSLSALVMVQSASGTRTSGRQVVKFELPAATCQFAGVSNLRQCTQKYNIVVNALDLGQRCPHNNARPNITPLQLNRLSVIMPDESKRVAAWRTYGVCSGLSDTRYFRELSRLSGMVAIPSIATPSRTTEIQKTSFIGQLMQENPRLQTESFDLICANNKSKQSMLTHIDICMTNGRFAACPVRVNNCSDKFLVMGD